MQIISHFSICSKRGVWFGAIMLAFAFAMALLSPTDEVLANDPPPDEEPIIEDMDGDGEEDEVTRDPGDGEENRPGEVEIFSGENGQLIVTLRGSNNRDEFGYSLAIFDLNLDNTRDLIIGAPKDDDGGSVFVFYGPFTDAGPLIQVPL